MASRLSAQRRARSEARAGKRRVKNYAPGKRPPPKVSLSQLMDQQEKADEARRRAIIEQFEAQPERG